LLMFRYLCGRWGGSWNEDSSLGPPIPGNPSAQCSIFVLDWQICN
jgi:hypothetical protein